MEIADLRSFLVIASQATLRAAAEVLHQSPSALSKALRRLETSLNTPLFDRVGKTIRLNADGERLRERAQALVALAEQTQTEFRGVSSKPHCRLMAPAVLQWRFGPALAQLLGEQYAGAGMAFAAMFEDAALAALVRGEGDFAMVTELALGSAMPAGLASMHLGAVTMQLAAGAGHPLLAQAKAVGVGVFAASTAAVLQYDFACPSRSMFCGLERGARADGWRDDRLPRRIRFWLDDLQLLLALVRSAQALAYVPDFALAQDPQLLRVQVSDCPYECVEQAYLVWRPATLSAWQQSLLDKLSRPSLRSPG